MSFDPDNPPRLKVANSILAAVRTLDSIFPKEYQVTLNKSDVSRGGTYWFVLTPAGWTPARLDAHDKLTGWRFRGELAVAFAEYNTRTEKFIKAAELVRNKLETPFALTGIKLNPPVVVTGEDLTQDIPGATPNWIVQTYVITVNTFVST